MNRVIARTNVGGITVSTIEIANQRGYETCLFDDRQGIRAGNPSRVVSTMPAGQLSRALGEHDYFAHMSTARLADIIARDTAVY